MVIEKKQELPELNIGVVGHIDHGKTTLLNKLTGKFADTHSEELKRGITIKLGYADATIYKDESYNISGEGEAKRYVSFIDAPGHEMLMATMLSGAALIDAAILVVAANEGIQPQTREHFMALQAKGINNLIIVQNKIDLVSKEEAMKNYKEIKEFIKGTSAENSPIIPLSAQQGINTDKLLEELCKLEIPQRDGESDPLFVVARSFDINKPGTGIDEIKGGILGGILKKGHLKVGDKIEIKPGLNVKKANQQHFETLETTIVSLHKGDKEVKEVYPGASISIETSLDTTLTKTDSLTGCVASKEGLLPEITQNITVSIELFEKVLGMEKDKEVENVKPGEMLMLSMNTAISVGTVKKIDKEGNLEMNLTIPIVPLKGENVGIARNINNHWRLIGFGKIMI